MPEIPLIAAIKACRFLALGTMTFNIKRVLAPLEPKHGSQRPHVRPAPASKSVTADNHSEWSCCIDTMMEKPNSRSSSMAIPMVAFVIVTSF